MEEDNKFLWNQFIKLGDMMGDGLHHESDGKWIVKEYNKLFKILCPPTEEEKAHKSEIRRKKNENIDTQITEKLKTDKCFKCFSELKQVRKGSKVVKCVNEECKAKFQYKSNKKR